MPKIKTKEATIQTFQVDIQTLRVNNKQVTMGLFRQLPLGCLIDPKTLDFTGLPWGHVRYWWEGDGRTQSTTPDLLHIVWQSDETLYRAIVDTTEEAPGSAWYRHRSEQFLTQYVLRRIPAAIEVHLHKELKCTTPYGYQYVLRITRVSLDGEDWNFWLEDHAEEQIVEQYVSARMQPTDDDSGAESEAYHALLARKKVAINPSACLFQSRDAIQQNALRAAKWQSHMQELRDVPQLFIAV